MGGSTPKQVVLDAVRKQAEEASSNKPISCIPPWLLLQCLPQGYCLEFLSLLSSVMECNLRV